MDSELLTCLVKFIEYFPDYLSALSRMLLRFFWTTFVETAVYKQSWTKTVEEGFVDPHIAIFIHQLLCPLLSPLPVLVRRCKKTCPTFKATLSEESVGLKISYSPVSHCIQGRWTSTCTILLIFLNQCLVYRQS